MRKKLSVLLLVSFLLLPSLTFISYEQMFTFLGKESTHEDILIDDTQKTNFISRNPQGYNSYPKFPQSSSKGYSEIEPIFIDDHEGGNYTWEDAVSESWCSGRGISTDPYLIENIFINGENASNCIEIRNSNAHFIIRNCLLNDSYGGMMEAGIKLSDTWKGIIMNNTISFNGYGIFIENISCDNMIIGNRIINNELYGIYSTWSYDNYIISNNISYNGASGICLGPSNNYIISRNVITHNHGGIDVGGPSNTISSNYFGDNFGRGISVSSPRQVIYNNTLVRQSSENVYDTHNDNRWYKGKIGNYYDDYNGTDMNGDHIGDAPYIINDSPLIQDNYPIWSDGPAIKVLSPNNKELFGDNSPYFIIEINESDINSMWYTLNNNITKYSFNENETINPVAWSLLPDGDTSIRFYANNTSGNINFKEVTVRKDTLPPLISIYHPTNISRNGHYSPYYDISILEPSLDSAWYSLNNNTERFQLDISSKDGSITNFLGYIDQDGWHDLPDGVVEINIRANDSMGRENFEHVIFMKDPSYVYKDLLENINIDDNWNKTFDYYDHLSLYRDGSNYITWEDASETEDWCSGAGTWDDPYIIENVYVNSRSIGSGISVWNSNSSFIIRNCHFHDSGSQEHDGGIRLIYARNGQLINNNLSYNHESIYALLSKNITISKNNILCDHSTSGYGRGIIFKDSSNSIISENDLINHYDGIVAWDSHNNVITKNFISTRLFGHYPDTGLYLVDSNYNTITFNIFAGDYANYADQFNGSIINEQNCIGNIIDGNFNNNDSTSGFNIRLSIQLQGSGPLFYLENSNYNYIYGNIYQKDGTPTSPSISGYNLIFLVAIIGLCSIAVVAKITNNNIRKQRN